MRTFAAACLAAGLLYLFSNVLSPPPGLLIVYHHVLFILGWILIVLLWGAHGPPYSIPRLLFLLFGVISPSIQMFFSIMLPFTPFQTSLFLLCPISFLLLFAIGLSLQRRFRQVKNQQWEYQLRDTQRALMAGPDNAAAYLKKAELLDSAGLSQEALQSYHRAHELSPRTLSAFDLRQVQRRLGSQTHPSLGEGWIFCLILASPLLALDARSFVEVLSVWLFCLWYNAAHGEFWSR